MRSLTGYEDEAVPGSCGHVLNRRGLRGNRRKTVGLQTARRKVVTTTNGISVAVVTSIVSLADEPDNLAQYWFGRQTKTHVNETHEVVEIFASLQNRRTDEKKDNACKSWNERENYRTTIIWAPFFSMLTSGLKWTSCFANWRAETVFHGGIITSSILFVDPLSAPAK